MLTLEQNGDDERHDGVLHAGASVKRELALIEGSRGLDTQKTAWSVAEQAGHLASAFDTFGIARACADTAESAGSTVITVVLGSGSDNRTIIPLRTEQHVGVRKAIPLTAPVSQYAPSIGAALTRRELEQLAASLCEQFGVDLLLLRRVRSENALYGALSRTALGGDPDTALFIDLKSWGSFEAYDKAFSNSTRRNRRQRRQKLEAEFGPVEFEVLDGGRAEAQLRTAMAWKEAWLREYGLPSPVLGDGLWRDALIACTQQSGAHASVMKAGGELAAVELGFSCGGEYIAYLGAFNPAMARFSVGQEQMIRTIAWCFEQKFTRYDLLAPDDPYKRFWTRDNGGEEVVDFMLPTSLAGQAYAFAHRRGRPLAKRLMHAIPAPIRRIVMHQTSAFSPVR